MRKRWIHYFCLVLMACLTSLPLVARTINIDATAMGQGVTQELRAACRQASATDTVVIAFGPGQYTIDGTIQCACHTVIKGAGRDRTVLLLDKGKDRAGFKAFPDDTFFKFMGTLNSPVAVSISDITFKLKEHNGIWWDGAIFHAVKIYHANKVDIHRVNSYMQDAIITNFDLRVCSHVSVTDCIISNYNNCKEGGNLWIRGQTTDVLIKGNKFYKYGNDEIIGFFSNLINNDGYIKGDVERSGIRIEDNELNYGPQDNKQNPDVINHTLLTLEGEDTKGQWKSTTRDIHIKNNKFSVNGETQRCLYIKFNENDLHRDIYIEGNQIINQDLHSPKLYYRYDIELKDASAAADTIHLINNQVTNNNSVLNPSRVVGYSCLYIRGGNVKMSGNRIVSNVTTDPFTGRDTGVQLVWCGAEGGTVTMTDNVAKGVMCVATVGAGSGTESFTLNAYNNYFTGDTRVYCHNVKELNLNFNHNTFKSRSSNFFLQEFAHRGRVVFNNNDITVTTGEGKLMTHWSNKSTNDMRFDYLEVKNNVFRGVKNEQDLFKHMTNVKKRSLRSNSIKRL